MIGIIFLDISVFQINKNGCVPFKILNKKEISPLRPGRVGVKLNKEGIEMLNAIKRRKESQKQHDTIINRIKHLQEAERKENFKMQQIQTQIEKFNAIKYGFVHIDKFTNYLNRKTQSEFLQKHSDIVSQKELEKADRQAA